MTAIDDFLVSSRERVSEIRTAARDYGAETVLQCAMMAEIHSVLTVIAQNMPCNVEANKPE